MEPNVLVGICGGLVLVAILIFSIIQMNKDGKAHTIEVERNRLEVREFLLFQRIQPLALSLEENDPKLAELIERLRNLKTIRYESWEIAYNECPPDNVTLKELFGEKMREQW